MANSTIKPPNPQKIIDKEVIIMSHADFEFLLVISNNGWIHAKVYWELALWLQRRSH